MSAPRPQFHYRQRLLDALAALRPGRVLEVGSGSGGFLRAAAAHLPGVELRGVDTAVVAALQAEGLPVEAGRAEQLPFGPGSFDAVVFCFSAHHVEHWSAALREALRVAARAVLVLDPWYERGLRSQRVAERFDRWCKAIDRSTGMVHHDCLDAAALLAPVEGQLGGYLVQVEHLLQLRELERGRFDEIARAQLAKAAEPPRWRDELAQLRGLAQRDGISDDGAILLQLAKPARR